MNAAVGLMDGLGLDGDRCIRVIPRHLQYLPDNGAFTQCEQCTSIHTGDWWLCDERVTLLPEPCFSAYLFWK